jgi:Uma2 family endonuclease
MQAVILDPPPEVIAERERLGLDHRDEVWEGRYHMVPPSSEEHQRLGTDLLLILAPLAQAQGILYRYETGVFDPDAHPANYCVPDHVAFRPEHRSPRGVEGRGELVVEFRSPGDETYQKLPFYERVGVKEVLVIDRDTRVGRHWVRIDDRLVEIDASTGAALRVLDVRLHVDGGVLVVETAAGTHRI